MIVIVDYDIGNIGSIINMFRRLGLPVKASSSEEEILQADRLILPGNGSFDACINNLRAAHLIPALEEKVLNRHTPLLGICVGAQMLGFSSEEGIEDGLGWIDMEVLRFPSQLNIRIPHMGWNNVSTFKHDHQFASSCKESRFYFIHSYYMKPFSNETVLFTTTHGISFASAVVSKNIVGVQFHPEKSHRYGKQLLSAFSVWMP